MRNVNTLLPATLLVVVVTIFLIGQRLDARWAGGEGRLEPCPATNLADGTIVKRGGTLSSTSNDFAKFQLCNGAMLYLDKNTELRLDSYRRSPAELTQLTLIQGRVLIDGFTDVKTRNLVFTTGAGCELVHYSWLDQVDTTPLVDQSCLPANLPVDPLVANYTTKYDTFDGSVVSTTVFEPANSSAKHFYEWTGLKLKGL